MYDPGNDYHVEDTEVSLPIKKHNAKKYVYRYNAHLARNLKYDIASSDIFRMLGFSSQSIFKFGLRKKTQKITTLPVKVCKLPRLVILRM